MRRGPGPRRAVHRRERVAAADGFLDPLGYLDLPKGLRVERLLHDLFAPNAAVILLREASGARHQEQGYDERQAQRASHFTSLPKRQRPFRGSHEWSIGFVDGILVANESAQRFLK